MKKCFVLLALVLTICLLSGCNDKKDKPEMAEQLTGTWNGTIDVPGRPLNIIVKFKQKDELAGTISIPVQNVADFSLSEIKLNDDKVNFKMPLQGQEIKFYGTIDKNKINGTFTQSDQSFPFELEKGDAAAGEPEEEEDFLTIETSAGRLYGSLLTPETEEPSPIALIIPGSGPTDRNGNSQAGRNDSLKLLAEGFAENGIASLRYDKRGAGKNQEKVIKEEDIRFDRFVKDAEKWIELLEQDERFTDIIIIGHSQGSLVGMMAAEGSAADVFISIAGAGRTIDEVLAEQLETLPDELNDESESILEELRRGKRVEEVDPRLMSIFKPSVQPFLMSWMDYNPTEEIRQISIPTLIINGKNDIQVSVADAENLAAAKPDAELLLIDKMNHVLKEAPENRDENLATYSDPTLPLANGLMEGIKEFLQNQITNRE
ncbi:alpha/beta hydrolase [Bacillus sp. Marseille-Q3570]|uniref:alpha/beta hydrolase n=1 Tax=Bacillus sp. Marseille-Q3570 TaxID=2963522 RepID=UPI0021B74333|nr:alpha/beta hydrolase [Bacillus sp. Marseille-Q3570]